MPLLMIFIAAFRLYHVSIATMSIKKNPFINDRLIIIRFH